MRSWRWRSRRPGQRAEAGGFLCERHGYGCHQQRPGIKPLAPELKRIDAIRTQADLQDEIARLHDLDVNVVFAFGPDQDAQHPEMVIGEFNQAGLSLPDRDYYTENDADKQHVRSVFVAHVQKTFALMGDPHAAANARAVLALETHLAKSSLSADEMRDPKALYNPTSLADLQKRSPGVDWNRYFDKLGHLFVWTWSTSASRSSSRS